MIDEPVAREEERKRKKKEGGKKEGKKEGTRTPENGRQNPTSAADRC
jgi:hypothetical protein